MKPLTLSPKQRGLLARAMLGEDREIPERLHHREAHDRDRSDDGTNNVLERAIFAAAFVKFLDEDMMQAGSTAREDATSRAMSLAFVAVDVFREIRKRRL